MKKIVTALFCLFVSAYTLHAQQEPNIGCVDKVIKLQAEGLKIAFEKQGMATYRDAMMNMTSQEPFPIAVQLDKGKLYQLIFVGCKESSKITMEIFDGDDKRIDKRTVKPDHYNESSNYIIYSFIPDKTDLYLLVLNQKQKDKKMCGSFTIMNKPDGTEKRHMDNQPEPAAKPNNNPRYVAPQRRMK